MSEWVEYYRSMGMKNLFPIKPGEKHPSLRGYGNNDNIPWKEEFYNVEKQWTEFPEDHGIGFVTGDDDIMVIDWDNDEFYYEFFDKNEKQLRTRTRVDKTGRGIHLFFRCKNAHNRRFEIPGRYGKIEILAEGIFCVLPPTIHPITGKPYETISLTNDVATVDVNVVVDNICNVFGIEDNNNTISQNPTGLSMEEINTGGLTEGNRNDAAFVKAKSLINPLEGALSQDQAWSQLEKWNQTNRPPLPKPELRTTFKSATKRHKNKTVKHFSKFHNFAEMIMEQITFKTMEDTHEILYYEEGRYVRNGETLIKAECEKLIPNCDKRSVSEIIAIIQRRSFIKREKLNGDFSRVSVNNGILGLETFELPKHDPKFLTTVKLPRSYNPKYKTPERFVKFLRDCLPPKDIITVVEEMANVLMMGRDNHEISAMWIGDGSNGKSQALIIIEGIYGADNCSHVSIHTMQLDRFALAETYGKLVNKYGDISSKELNHLGIFKQVVSGDRTRGQRKNQQPFDFEPFCKCFFSANQMPKFNDNSDAPYRRIYVTKWENQFIRGVNEIRNLGKTIVKHEADDIFSMIVENYKTLKRNDGFRYRQSIAHVRETIKKEADKLQAFIDECLIKDPLGKEEPSYISKDYFFKIHQDYFEEHNYDIYTKQKLGATLPTYGFKDDSKKINGKTIRFWIGWSFNPDSEWNKSHVKDLSSSSFG